MARGKLRYLKRGQVVEIDAIDPNRTLLDHIRLDRRETGVKEGCNEGDCGACTVVLASVKGGKLVYEAVNSCILLAGQADGTELITVEDLAADGVLHPVQQALVDAHGSQCGFCTPGIVMSLFALYHSGGEADRGAINDQLAGNLCRCTGYRPIINAALAVCDGMANDRFRADEEVRSKALAALADGDDLFVGDGKRFFAAPATVASLANLLQRYPDVRIVGGATDVGLWLTKQLRDIPRVVWLGRVAELAQVASDDKALVLGAGVTLADAMGHLATIDPDLGEVLRRFGSAQVRATGTVGGNIGNGSPIGDLAPCLIALGGSMTLRKGEAARTIAVEDFFIDYGKQDRAPGEIVASLTIPRLKAGQRFRAYKVSKRFDEDISAVLGAFQFDLDGRVIRSARVAFGGMAATPRRGAETEAALSGASIDRPLEWEGAIAALGEDFSPISDARASAEYRLATARALLQKALFEISASPSSVTRILAVRGANA